MSLVLLTSRVTLSTNLMKKVYHLWREGLTGLYEEWNYQGVVDERIWIKHFINANFLLEKYLNCHHNLHWPPRTLLHLPKTITKGLRTKLPIQEPPLTTSGQQCPTPCAKAANSNPSQLSQFFIMEYFPRTPKPPTARISRKANKVVLTSLQGSLSWNFKTQRNSHRVEVAAPFKL